MMHAKSLLHLDLDIAKFSPCIVQTSTVPSARRCISHAYRQWKDHMFPLFQRQSNTRFSLVALLGKFAFRIQNPYLLILLIVV